MPIERITQLQFAAQLGTAINDRDADVETAYGPVADTCVFPQAAVLENQNDRIRLLSLMLTLADPEVFSGYETDLEGIVYNETETRSLGAGASTILYFQTTTPPLVDAPVQRGYPAATEVDAATGASVTFVTTVAAVMPAASASSYFNITTQKYELPVPAIATVSGADTNVGPERVTRPLRPLGTFESVSNRAAAQGGRGAETNAELVARYLLAITGNQTGVATGIQKRGLAAFPDAEALYVVYGTDALLTRAATDAGAVDTWVKGQSLVQLAENQTFLGVGQLVEVNQSPLVSVATVASGGTTYVEGTDYEVVEDDSGVSGSVRAADGVRFLSGGAAPAVGATVTVTYAFDNLILGLQGFFDQPDQLELGRDLLFRRGIDTPFVHTAVLSVLSGFSTTVVLEAVRTAVLDFFAGLGLGGSVQGSDIQEVVRAVSGVDNYVITRLTLATVAFGTADVTLAGNQYPTLSPADLSITF